MPRPATDKRERLTGAALDLAYRHGFERASIAEIAAEASVAPGSVYYYFKSRDDVGQAVADELARRYRLLMVAWSDHEDPRDRLVALIDSYRNDSDAVRNYGCPLATLSTELGRQSDELGAAAAAVLNEVIEWATAQFIELGHPASAAHSRAVHLVAVIQGAATLTHTLDSPEPLALEAAHLERWVRR